MEIFMKKVNSDLKKWSRKMMTTPYLKWREREDNLLESLTKEKNIIDLCCGDAEVLKVIGSHVESYVGVDMNINITLKAQNLSKKFHQNINISKPMDYKDFLKSFNREYKNYMGILIGNTLGALPSPFLPHIRIISECVDSLFISTIKKGTLNLRKEVYDKMKHTYDINFKTEVISSDLWGEAHSFSYSDLYKLYDGVRDLGYNKINYFNFGELSHAILISK